MLHSKDSLVRRMPIRVLMVFSLLCASSAASVTSQWAVSIGARVEDSLRSRSKRRNIDMSQTCEARPDYRGGAAAAAVKTMTARQMEAFK